MGNWNTHGMDKDEDVQRDACDTFGFFPEELTALADHADKEVWIWTEMAKQQHGQQKRKSNLIAGFWRRRGRRWKELSAWVEEEFAHMDEKELAKMEGDPRGA